MSLHRVITMVDTDASFLTDSKACHVTRRAGAERRRCTLTGMIYLPVRKEVEGPWWARAKASASTLDTYKDKYDEARSRYVQSMSP